MADGDGYWLSQGRITKEEHKQAFTYLKKHDLPQDEKHLKHRVARIRKRRELNRFLKGKEEASADPNTPWQIVYGNVQLGGTMTFVHTSGPANQKDLYLHMIITLAAHEIYYIEKIFFDGYEVLWDTTLNTRPTGLVQATGLFAGYVKLQINYGSDSQSALSVPVGDSSDALNPVSAKWTSNHRQRGHAHVYFRFKWNEVIFKDGIPDITFKVQGKYVIVDPRTGSPSPGAANAAMVLNDYMRDSRWGLNVQAAEFNTTRLNQAVSDCEDAIPLSAGGTENRYLINTHFGADQSPGAVIEDMLASMHGRLPYTQGKFSLWAGKARAGTVLTITADMILSDINVLTKTPRADSFNAVRGTFVSGQNENDESDFPAVRNSTYETQDNGQTVYEDLTYSMVTSATTVQRLAKIELEANRQGIVVEFLARLDVYQAEPGEWVAVTYSRFGWSAKVFEVVRSSLVIEQDSSGSPFFAVRVSLQETGSGVYSWSAEETTFDVAPNTNLPNPFTVTDPTSLTLASGTSHLYLRNDGTVFSRLYASWTGAADAFVVNGGYYEIQFKKSAASDWQDAGDIPGSSTNYYILDVDDGNAYDVRIRSVSAMGARGNWVTTTGHTVLGKTVPPTDPTGLTGSLQDYGIKLFWDRVADLDVNEYEVRLSTTPGGDIYTSTSIAWIKTTTFYYEPKVAGVYRFFIRSLDTSGNYSGNTVYVDVTVGAPSTPTVTAALDSDNYVLSWTASTGSFAIKEYVIRYGDTYAGGTALATVSALRYRFAGTWSGARTFWVAPVDIIGNVGTAASVTVTIGDPQAVVGLRVLELNGNIMLSWGPPASTTLPIAKYEVYVGDTFNGARLLDQAFGTFFTYLEQSADDYTYWVRPIDTAGNLGGTASVTISSRGTSSFVLVSEHDLSPATATLTNALRDGCSDISIFGPANTTETWSQHFINNGFTTIQQFIDAGHIHLLEPTSAAIPGRAEWTIDLGSKLKKVTLNFAYLVYALRNVGIALPTLFWREKDFYPWVSGGVGNTTALATNARYIKVRVDLNGQWLNPAIATLTNAVTEYDGSPSEYSVIAPMNATETFAEHFTNNGKVTVQEFIDAGYFNFGVPSATTPGVIEWLVDMAQDVPATSLYFGFNSTQLTSGQSYTLRSEISYKLTNEASWTFAGSATNGDPLPVSVAKFRYLKVVVTVTPGTGSNPLVELSRFSLRVGSLTYDTAQLTQAKLTIGYGKRTDSGTATVSASDSGGTTIPFNLTFVDVDSIVVTPNGTTPIDWVVDFDDEADPVSFNVLLFDSSGARLSGTVRWNATGVLA
jgi:hypothetical protein